MSDGAALAKLPAEEQKALRHGSEAERKAARELLSAHTISLSRSTGTDNEQIDADLARELTTENTGSTEKDEEYLMSIDRHIECAEGKAVNVIPKTSS